MQKTRALLAVCFCAGLLGALCNSLAFWGAGHWGLTAMAGVGLAPTWSAAWLYPRLIRGGLWGLVFYLLVAHPRARRHWARKGLWVSLLPTLLQLFYIFPQEPAHGPMGVGLGSFTPAFVLLFNAIWGFCTGVFTRLLWGKE
ncbi:MAG: hypothetical protein WDA20_06915 [Desulfuromonadales bacterium]|jgi:hypothetical protein